MKYLLNIKAAIEIYSSNNPTLSWNNFIKIYLKLPDFSIDSADTPDMIIDRVIVNTKSVLGSLINKF